MKIANKSLEHPNFPMSPRQMGILTFMASHSMGSVFVSDLLPRFFDQFHQGARSRDNPRQAKYSVIDKKVYHRTHVNLSRALAGLNRRGLIEIGKHKYRTSVRLTLLGRRISNEMVRK